MGAKGAAFILRPVSNYIHVIHIFMLLSAVIGQNVGVGMVNMC